MSKTLYIRTARQAAFVDMRPMLEKMRIDNNRYGENYVIGEKEVATRKTTAFNRQLGIHRLNMLDNKNGCKN